MYPYFKAISLSHKNAPLSVRELLALSKEESQDLLSELKLWEDISDLLILSTCNRTEIYYNSSIDYSSQILQRLFEIKKISADSNCEQYFAVYTQPDEAVNHLFQVAMGLESQVLGDIQIINQVKNAYQLSADMDVAGPFLHRLLHTIFFTNKKVVQETPFRSGAASLAYAALELLEEFALQMPNPKVLILGLGEIGADLCRNLKSSFIKNITVINRTLEKARQLAEECGAIALPFEKLYESVQEADIIVSSIASEKTFITKDFVKGLDLHSFKYFIDLSVPRSISPDVEEINGILVYNLDQINSKINESLQKRLAAIPDVKAFIREAIDEFKEWAKEMEISPTIQKLKNALEQIRLEELNRFQKNLSVDESLKIDKITKSMMQKIIKLPALQLKAACKRGEAETLIDVLNDLFNLENQPEKAE